MFSIDYIPTTCAAKNGTFATLRMLQSQEVDVIFGATCSPGEVWKHPKQIAIVINYIPNERSYTFFI